MELTPAALAPQTLVPMQEAWLDAHAYPWCPDIWCAHDSVCIASPRSRDLQQSACGPRTAHGRRPSRGSPHWPPRNNMANAFGSIVCESANLGHRADAGP